MLNILKILVSVYLHLTLHKPSSIHYRQVSRGMPLPPNYKSQGSSQSSLIVIFSRTDTHRFSLVSVLNGFGFLPIPLTTSFSCSSMVCSLAHPKILCFSESSFSCSQLLNSCALFQLISVGWCQWYLVSTAQSTVLGHWQKELSKSCE